MSHLVRRIIRPHSTSYDNACTRQLSAVLGEQAPLDPSSVALALVSSRQRRKGTRVASITDICNTYGISRSTARRRVKDCFGGAPMVDGRIELDASQAHEFANYMGKQGTTAAPADAPETRQRSAIDAPEVRALVAQYEARISDMQTEIDRLHEALAREQQSRVGFWSRLGRKLLGDGTHD